LRAFAGRRHATGVRALTHSRGRAALSLNAPPEPVVTLDETFCQQSLCPGHDLQHFRVARNIYEPRPLFEKILDFKFLLYSFFIFTHGFSSQ
jgi:hypothetical protein